MHFIKVEKWFLMAFKSGIFPLQPTDETANPSVC